MISSESRMREIRTSGLMSEDWKRGCVKLARQSSTLPLWAFGRC